EQEHEIVHSVIVEEELAAQHPGPDERPVLPSKDEIACQRVNCEQIEHPGQEAQHGDKVQPVPEIAVGGGYVPVAYRVLYPAPVPLVGMDESVRLQQPLGESFRGTG